MNPKTKATQVQIAFMVNFMDEHPEVAKGHISNSLQDKLVVEKHWEALSKDLNALGGAIKTVSKWKQAWRDLKNNVKKKAGYRRSQTLSTGLGSSTSKNISDVQEQVMAVMGPITFAGAGNLPVTMGEIPNYPVFNQQETPASPTLPGPPKKINPATIRPKFTKRRRLVRPIDNFNLKLLRLEEKKLAIKREENLIKRDKLNLAKEKVDVLKRIADSLENIAGKLFL